MLKLVTLAKFNSLARSLCCCCTYVATTLSCLLRGVRNCVRDFKINLISWFLWFLTSRDHSNQLVAQKLHARVKNYERLRSNTRLILMLDFWFLSMQWFLAECTRFRLMSDPSAPFPIRYFWAGRSSKALSSYLFVFSSTSTIIWAYCKAIAIGDLMDVYAYTILFYCTWLNHQRIV